jgi:hypothetical protein
MMVSRFAAIRRSARDLDLPGDDDVEPVAGGPSANTVCPRGKSTGCSCEMSAETALGSTPWKIPALARISSTLPS